MSAINLTTAMDGLGTAAATWTTTGWNVYTWPVDAVTVPCVLVDFPSSIDLMTTMQRGGDHVLFPIYVLVGLTTGKDARDALSAAISGSSDLVAALEATTGFGDVDIASAEIAQVAVAGVTYIGLKLIADVLT